MCACNSLQVTTDKIAMEDADDSWNYVQADKNAVVRFNSTSFPEPFPTSKPWKRSWERGWFEVRELMVNSIS